MPNLFYFKKEKVLRRKGEAQKKRKRPPASLCSRVYTVRAVWAQRDSKLGTKVASVSEPPVRRGTLWLGGEPGLGQAAEQVDVAVAGSLAQPAPRGAWPASAGHTHPDDEAVTQRQLRLWQRLRVLHGPRTSTPRSQRRTRLPTGARVNDLRARHRSSAARPGARAAHAREASRRRRRGATAPLPTAAVPCHGT